MEDDALGFRPLVEEICVGRCKPATGDIDDLQPVTLEACVLRKNQNNRFVPVTHHATWIGWFANEFSCLLRDLGYIEPVARFVLSPDKADRSERKWRFERK